MPDRSYAIDARSTDVFGRVLVSARDQHFIADGPLQNGCPGEAVTPAELFLAGIATCAVELVQVLAREQSRQVGGVSASIEGTIPAERIREDVSIFSKVVLRFDFAGVGDEDAAALVEAFKGR